MSNVVSAVRDTVSITQFNRGLAGKIFDEVRHSGAKVVIKNNSAECVLLSPEEYVRLMDEVDDARLLKMAAARLEHVDSSVFIPSDEVERMLDISEEELAAADEVDFE